MPERVTFSRKRIPIFRMNFPTFSIVIEIYTHLCDTRVRYMLVHSLCAAIRAYIRVGENATASRVPLS